MTGDEGGPASPDTHNQAEMLGNGDHNIQHEATPGSSGQEAPHPQLMAQMEQYRRMEQCLYKHRKEWEAKGGPGSWCMFPEPREYGRCMPNGPWTHGWTIDSDRRYQRPDPFDPSHNCISGTEANRASDSYDDFDHVVDYGDRRERLRKNFEWEMDRLFLAEETERRRRATQKQHRHGSSVTETEDAQRRDHKPSLFADNPEAHCSGFTTFAKPKLNRLSWLSFKQPDVITEQDVCVIDVLIGEPILDRNKAIDSARRARELERFTDHKAISCKLPGLAQLPERVRIHSLILLRIMYRILGSEGTSLVNDKRFPVLTSPVIMTRPFKVLTHCEHGLREWCRMLEKKFKTEAASEELANDPSEASGATESEQEEDDDSKNVTKSLTALEHLRCLLSFMDSDISPRHAYLEGAKFPKIFFSDIWFLFRPGVEVIGSDGKQAYRIINITSTKHHTSPAWQQGWQLPSTNKHHKTSFNVTCVYIDFDGKYLGPVKRNFEFKSFEGEKDVNSLEVYPLRFHPLRKMDFTDAEWKEIDISQQQEWYRQKLIRRGTKFLEVAAVKHMEYAGPTLVVRDEVESQVVVDFETAFSAEGQQVHKPQLGVLLGSPGSEDPEGEDTKDSCRAACCRDEEVHDDGYVDQRETDEYIEGLLPKSPFLDKHPSLAITPQLMKELQASVGNGHMVSDDDLVIMSYRVFGFVLRSRKWGKLFVGYGPSLYWWHAN